LWVRLIGTTLEQELCLQLQKPSSRPGSTKEVSVALIEIVNPFSKKSMKENVEEIKKGTILN
jgi:hypothetical protein